MAFHFVLLALSHGVAENLRNGIRDNAKVFFLAPCHVEEARRDAGWNTLPTAKAITLLFSNFVQRFLDG
jgi:hypothetical protein